MKSIRKCSFTYLALLGILIPGTACNKIEVIEVNPEILIVDGQTKLFDIEIINDSTLFTCGGKRWEEGFIFKSTDGGTSWVKSTINDQKCVYTLSFVDENLGYAGSDFIRLYETKNGGDTWSLFWISDLAYHEVHRPSIKNIQIINENDFAFVAGENYTVGNVYRSYDAGSNWKFDTLTHELRALHFLNEELGFIGGYGYLAKTTNGGMNWEQLNFQGDFIVGIQILNEMEIVAAGNNGSIYKSTDQGTSWDEMLDHSGVLEEQHSFQNLYFVNESVGFAIGAYGLILKSENGGKDWKKLDTGIEDHLYSIKHWGNKIYISTHKGRILVLDY